MSMLNAIILVGTLKTDLEISTFSACVFIFKDLRGCEDGVNHKSKEPERITIWLVDPIPKRNNNGGDATSSSSSASSSSSSSVTVNSCLVFCS
jgi:hypothetical protein